MGCATLLLLVGVSDCAASVSRDVTDDVMLLVSASDG